MGNKLRYMKRECEAIRTWLKKPGNTPAGLAVALGYRDSNTINVWLSRGRIAKFRVNDVMKIVAPELVAEPAKKGVRLKSELRLKKGERYESTRGNN